MANRKKIAVLFSGKGSNFAYIVKTLHHKEGFEVVVALTNNPNAQGISVAKEASIPLELPRHKGLNAIEKSYEDEHTHGGASVHYVTSELDGGEVILQKEVAKEGLSFEAYDEKIRSIEKEALVEAIRKVLA